VSKLFSKTVLKTKSLRREYLAVHRAHVERGDAGLQAAGLMRFSIEIPIAPVE
jgi:hypothetical protein